MPASNVIDLRKAIMYATGRNLRLGGGMGLSVEDPIVVTENHHGNAVTTEHFAAKEIAIFYGWWKASFGKIVSLENEGGHIDEFEINCFDDNDNPRQEKLYFDVTMGYNNILKTLEQLKTPEELKQIHNNTYYSAEDRRLDKFYGAFSYARTLRPNEKLNTSSLQILLHIGYNHGSQLIKALEDCGFVIDR